jgi:hypothetical protein
MIFDDAGLDDPLVSGRDWIAQRILATRILIVKYEAAIDALSVGGVQSYQLDTGQTRQLVTKMQLGSLQLMIGRLESRLSTLEQRLGAARIYVRPAW